VSADHLLDPEDLIHTLFGSLTKMYLPSGCFKQRSASIRTIPHPLATETLSCAAKSVGRTEVALKMTWRVLSRGVAREMYLHEAMSGWHSNIMQKRRIPDLHEISASEDALNGPLG
jgi:hypothetical protein